MGLKASEMGANAVIGYRLCLDLEGDVGVAVRGIGTAVTLIKIPDTLNAFTDNVLIEEWVFLKILIQFNNIYKKNVFKIIKKYFAN